MLVTDGEAADPTPPSMELACVSPTDSPAGPAPASAARGSQNTVTTPRTVSEINVQVTTVDVRSPDAEAPDGFPEPEAGGDAFAFGGAAIGRSIRHIMTLTSFRILTAVTALGVALGVLTAAVPVRAAAPKFYFRLGEVKAGPEVNDGLKAYAGEAVKADLAARPEWASDVGTTDPEALRAELKKRNLRGFSVVVRFERFAKQLKEPSPGSRHKRASVDVKLSVFGTTIPEEKLAFSGEGESTVEAEVSEKTAAEESESLAKDAIKDAIKQAVDQAVLKLSIGKSGPMNESAKRRKKK